MTNKFRGKKVLHICKICKRDKIPDLVLHMATKHNDEQSQKILKELDELEKKQLEKLE